MQHRIRAGIAGLLVAAAAAPVAHAADITVRAEGFFGTVVPQTTVSDTGSNALQNGKSCPGGQTGRTAAGALERATAGNWDGGSFSFGLTVERIITTDLGGFPDGTTYWNFDVDNASQQVGICDVNPQAGDELLFYEACAAAGETKCFTGTPLAVSAPATATAGEPFTVTVVQFDDSKDPALSVPSSGATVTAGNVNATTGAAGTATLTLSQTGPVTLVATKGRQVRDATTVTVAAPVYSVPAPTPTPTATPIVGDPLPQSTIRSPSDNEVFRNGGPRKLRAVTSASVPLAAVNIALTRRLGKRCGAFDGDSERFRSVRCGRRPRFGVGTARRLSFLLPARLDRGRYAFEVVATDADGRTESVQRGRNRVVFRVR